ncbi:MAG: hypothetical protein QG635_1694 [Bacteroidota bacterium]|nr:hypothetical protein [Bacteroidota bacterium]
MDLLLLVNGKKETLIEANKLDENSIHTIKIDEKNLGKPNKMKKLLQSGHYNKVLFGCMDLDLQRFIPLMKLHIFLSGIRSGAVIDHYGKQIRYGTIKFLFADLPLLAIETIASGGIIFYYYFKLLALRWTLKINH